MTTNNQQPTTAQPRGTIILDANALIHLAVPVSPTLRANGSTPETYLDILTFLANHDYRIFIPEMVSVEAGSLLASGRSIDSVFSDFDNPHHERSSVIRAFLKQKNPNIQIITETGPTEIDAYCDSLQHALKYKTPLERRRSRSYTMSSFEAARAGRGASINVLKQQSTKDFGDQAIMSLLKSNREEIIDAENLSVLTVDGDLKDKIIQQHPYIDVVSIDKLCYAFGETNLPHHMGFPKHVSGQDLMAQRIHSDTQDTRRNSFKSPKLDFKISTLNTDFYGSLQQLADELKQAQGAAATPAPALVNGGSPDNRTSDVGVAGSLTRSDMFVKKFGGAVGGLTTRRGNSL